MYLDRFYQSNNQKHIPNTKSSNHIPACINYDQKKDLLFMRLCLLLAFLTILFSVFSVIYVLSSDNVESIEIIDNTIRDEQLLITVSGDGIQYENCFQYTRSHGIEYVIDYDIDSQYIVFNYRDDVTNVYIPNDYSETAHFVLSPID